MDVHEFRQLVLDDLLARKNAKGEAAISEEQAKRFVE